MFCAWGLLDMKESKGVVQHASIWGETDQQKIDLQKRQNKKASPKDFQKATVEIGIYTEKIP